MQSVHKVILVFHGSQNLLYFTGDIVFCSDVCDCPLLWPYERQFKSMYFTAQKQKALRELALKYDDHNNQQFLERIVYIESEFREIER